MHLKTTITDEQREALEASAFHLDKLLKKFATLARQQAEYQAIKTKAIARLAAAEKTAAEKAGEEAGEAASAKALAIRHQLGQLDLTLRRGEREFTDLTEEATTAAFFAKKEVRTAHRPLVESLISEATEFLTPFCERPHAARVKATELFSIGQIQHYTSPSYFQPHHFRDSDALLSAIASIGKTLSALLAGEAVVTVSTNEKEGGLVFPAFL